MIYVIIVLLIIPLILYYDLSANKRYKIELFLFLLVALVALASFRYRVGSDTMSYMDQFKDYKSLAGMTLKDWTNQMYLPGWVFIMSLLKSLSFNFFAFQIFHAVLINVTVFCFLWKYTKHPFSGVLVYFVVFYPEYNFEILRQSISISIFLLAYPLLEKRSFLKYFICIAFACLFHESSLLLLLLPFFSQKRICKVFFVSFLIAVIILFFLANFIRNSIMESFMAFSFLKDKSWYYFNDLTEENEFIFGINRIFNLILNILLPLYAIYKFKNEKKTNLFYRLCMFSMLIYVFSSFLPIFYRFNAFFIPFIYLIYVDFFVSLCKRLKMKSVCYTAILCLFLLIKARFYVMIPDRCPVYIKYLPYTSVFTEQKDVTREKYYNK